MAAQRCPSCGGTMHPTSQVGTSQNGNPIIAYVCDNASKCRTVIHVEEKK